MTTEESSSTKKKKETTTTEKKNEENNTKKPQSSSSSSQQQLPPLEAAARRLERLLGGGLSVSEKDRLLFTNPTKVVRRWLGTASGAAGKATFTDIVEVATKVLDPQGPCANGRALCIAVGKAHKGDDDEKEKEGKESKATTKDDKKEGKATTTKMDVDNNNNNDTTTTAVAMETTSTAESATTTTATPSSPPVGYLSSVADREVESWLISLTIRLLFRKEYYEEALDVSHKGITIVTQHLDTAASSKLIMSRTTGASTAAAAASSLFPLLARMFRFRSLVAESILSSSSSTATTTMKNKTVLAAGLRQDMAMAHNMACLRRDVDCQATLLNCMLRDLLLNSQVEQAQKLLSNSTFPDSASNNQLCRYLYYSGRIQALRLEYTSAHLKLRECLRKAPTNTGLGFRIAVQRLLVVVQLLMGEIPDRHVFVSNPGMKVELHPYLAITQAVRQGDLAVFTSVVSDHSKRLQDDGTYTLISRLAHQVVKTGLCKLHVSYSRLSLQDVADRLGLPSATSAEFVVAKAVRDGVLDATIHHEEAYVQSHDLVDVYATKEPAEAFHRRIAYCLTTHNDAVRGMRYPPDAYKKQLEASRGNRRKNSSGDDKTDEEKAQELEDELDEDY